LRPRVVMPYCMPANLAVGLVWRMTGARVCVWQQRDEGLMRRPGFIERLAVALTPGFISNSTPGSDFLHTSLRVPRDRIHLVNNGVAMTRPAGNPGGWKQRHGLPPASKLIAMVAHLHEHKDHMTLLRAWQMLATQNALEGWVLVLAGRRLSGANHIDDFVSTRKLEESVVQVGKVDDVAELLADAAFVVHSSLTEGVPNAVLEAMAAGRAVIGTDIPGIRQAIGDDTPQQRTAPSDPCDLAAKMQALMADPDLCAELGAMNRRRSEHHFGVDRMVMETMAAVAAVEQGRGQECRT